MAPPPQYAILVIEDDEDTRANLQDILELDDFRVVTAATAAEGLKRILEREYLAVILDRRLPDAMALDVLPRLRQSAPDTDVIVVTGFGDLEGAIVALRHGAADYILKPLSPDALRASLGRIAEHHRLRLEKRRSEAAFRVLIDAAEFVVVIMRPDLTVCYISPFAERLLGRSNAEVVGADAREVFRLIRPPELTDEAVRRLSAGLNVRGLEDQIIDRHGARRWMMWNACPLDDYEGSAAFLAVAQDITQVKQAQERALQAERLAAIGQMVTGLAHESRNALQRSQACLEMLALEVRGRPAALDLIRRLQAAQDHLAYLYEDVRGYASPLRLDRQPAELRAVWRSAWDQLHTHPQHAHATLREHLGCPGPRCEIDAFRIEQVFRNLFENALAVSPHPILIDIACQPTMLDEQPAAEIRVRDYGPGLSADQRARMFEPFFTTKTKGTGLGMAIASRIVEAHGGRIHAGAPIGPGAEIVLTLPRGNT